MYLKMSISPPYMQMVSCYFNFLLLKWQRLGKKHSIWYQILTIQYWQDTEIH